MKAALLALLIIAIAAILSTRRLGWGNWQSWCIYGLMVVAAAIGRWA
jgi:hypothetical protein